MTRAAALAILCAVWLSCVPPAGALEFSADQITKINGRSRKANIYYRDDRWRLEHHDMGPVNVTIVPAAKLAMQVPPHTMPVGLEVTVPLPLPVLAIVNTNAEVQ